MGSKGSNQVQTQSSQQYTPNPAIAAAGYQALSGAQTAAQAPFQMPTAPVAPFNPFQQQAFGQVQGAQGMAQPYFGMGLSNLEDSAHGITPQDVSNYYNPMAANVTSQMQNIFGQQQRNTTGQLTQAAGGVGADRIAVGQSELANQQGLAAGQTYAGLYQQALQAAQQQKQMEAGAGYGEAQMGPAAQAAYLQGTSALGGAGNQQQQQTQAQLNAPYQNQLAQIAYPFQTPQYLAGITGGLAPAMGGSSSGQSTSTYPSPSPLSQILGVGTSLLGMGGMGGLFGGGGGSKGSSPQIGSTYGATNNGSGFGYGSMGGVQVPTYFKRGGRMASGGSTYGDLAAQHFAYTGVGNPYATSHDSDDDNSFADGGSPDINEVRARAQEKSWINGQSAWDRARVPFQLKAQGLGYQRRAQAANNEATTPDEVYDAVHRADGGSTPDDPNDPSMGLPFPGASVPKAGTASPIPHVSLPMGAGHSSLMGGQGVNTNPVPMPQGGGGGGGSSSSGSSGGSGSALPGEIATGVSAAMKILPFLLAKRGGGVSPYDMGQSFDDGGDVDFPFESAGSDSPGDLSGYATAQERDMAAHAKNQWAQDYQPPPPAPLAAVGNAIQQERGNAPSPYQPAAQIPADFNYETASGSPDQPQNTLPQTTSTMPQARPMGAPGAPDSTIERAANVTKGQESGGNYQNVTTTRDRNGNPQNALGAYGIMEANLPQWSKEVFGQPVSKQDFLYGPNAKNIQDAIYRNKMQGYINQHGVEGAGRAWLGGEGNVNNPYARDPLGTSTGDYGRTFAQKVAAGDSGETPEHATPIEFRRPNSDMTMENAQMPRGQMPYPGASQHDWGQTAARSPWMSLVKAGAAMASSTGPIGSVIGRGIAAGAGELEGQRKSLQSEEDINQKANHLFQQAKQHLDTYQRMTPYQQELVAAGKGNFKMIGKDPDSGEDLMLDTKSGRIVSSGQVINPLQKPTALQSNIEWLKSRNIGKDDQDRFQIAHSGVNNAATYGRLVQAEKKYLSGLADNAGKPDAEIETMARANVTNRGFKPVDAGSAPAAAPATTSELPPEAASKLKEGEPTKFNNGQVWTLKNGKPERVQ